MRLVGAVYNELRACIRARIPRVVGHSMEEMGGGWRGGEGSMTAWTLRRASSPPRMNVLTTRSSTACDFNRVESTVSHLFDLSGESSAADAIRSDATAAPQLRCWTLMGTPPVKRGLERAHYWVWLYSSAKAAVSDADGNVAGNRGPRTARYRM